MAAVWTVALVHLKIQSPFTISGHFLLSFIRNLPGIICSDHCVPGVVHVDQPLAVKECKELFFCPAVVDSCLDGSRLPLLQLPLDFFFVTDVW